MSVVVLSIVNFVVCTVRVAECTYGSSTQTLTPVIVVIVILLVVTFLFIVGCLGLCIKIWSSRRVYSAGPGPPMTGQRGERAPSVGIQLPGQPPSYQSGPALLPPTYNAVMGNSCEYPTVAHGGEVPNGNPPPPRDTTVL